jgi:hypothetical protein
MAVEKADLSVGLSFEPTAPVAAPATQGQTAPEGGQSQPRRRTPPKEAAAEPQEGDLDQEDRDQPPHRIDRLA